MRRRSSTFLWLPAADRYTIVEVSDDQRQDGKQVQQNGGDGVVTVAEQFPQSSD